MTWWQSLTLLFGVLTVLLLVGLIYTMVHVLVRKPQRYNSAKSAKHCPSTRASAPASLA